MFTAVQKFIGDLKDRWSSVGPAIQLLIATLAVLIPALAALWLVDKLFVYLLARSYVNDVANVFDLNEHLAQAISLVVFATAVYLIGKTLSRSRTSRRVGYLGIAALLVGNSLILWQGAKGQYFDRSGKGIKCYVLTREGEVRWGEHPGIDPATGRECVKVKRELADRLIALTTQPGRKPQQITSPDPTFFDPRSGEPVVWYSKDKNGAVEIFDLMGYHPETGEELQPVTRDIVDQWKTQNTDIIKTLHAQRPKRIDDPERYAFFDVVTGKPRVWYWRGPNGEYEFYDNQGFHPRTGEPLAVITKEEFISWKNRQQKAADEAAKEEQKRLAALKKKQDDDAALAAKQDQLWQAELQKQQQLAEKMAAEQAQAQQSASRCDQLAANPTDQRKPADVPGVRYDDLKTQAKEALAACTLAMKTYPAEQRFRYQFARALQVDEPHQAFKLHKQLVRDGYLASYDNAGSILINTYKNIPEAISLFKEGARRGDPDSMVSLADLVGKHYVFENNPEAARYTLLSRAAELGHPGARLAIEQEQIKFQQLQQQQEFQRQQAQIMLQLFGTILQNVPR